MAYALDKPWRGVTERVQDDLRESLNSWGDWSFMGSRNDPIHSYPSTFVHTIPAAFIKSLRLSGDTLLDPFCGSGVTGIEGIKAGCRVVSADINEVALLISRVKSTYLTIEQRARLRNLRLENLIVNPTISPPKLDKLHKWHHVDTIHQLTSILSVIEQAETLEEREFLRLCFSAILTATTARRGKQHGWFADNTPLAKGVLEPPFIDAYSLFLAKVAKNIKTLESIYSVFERRGEKPNETLARFNVLRANVAESNPEAYGIEPNSIGGIITSPPYLCMSDYSLGQRLSYAWLFPDHMARDFNVN